VTVPGEGVKLPLPGELPVAALNWLPEWDEALLGVARPPFAVRSRSRRFCR